MISIDNLDIYDHWKNPKTLRLTVYMYDGDDCKDMKLIFKTISKNKVIEELRFDEPDKLNGHNIEGSFLWIEHIKFPPNLKKLVLPESYGSYLYWCNDEYETDDQLQMPPNLETVVMPDYNTFRFINLNNTKIKNIIVCNTRLHVASKGKKLESTSVPKDQNSVHSNYNMITLKSIQFFSCNSIPLLNEIMKNVKLPYECVYTASSSEYVE